MKKSKWIKITVGAFLLLGVERFCHWQTDGFRLAKATCETSHVLRYPLPSLETEEVNQILAQPFYYLAAGKQSYVFSSEDGKTILKLFKHHHFGFSNTLLSKLPFTATLIQERERRLQPLLKSTLIAYLRLPIETGVFYLHLEKTRDLHPTITLYDKIHIAHQLKLDDADFVLQRYAEPTKERLTRLLNQGKIEEARACIDQLTRFMMDCSLKGIKNKDPKILENTGFYQDTPQILDIGSLTLRKKSNNPHPELTLKAKIKRQLSAWASKNYPQYGEI